MKDIIPTIKPTASINFDNNGQAANIYHIRLFQYHFALSRPNSLCNTETALFAPSSLTANEILCWDEPWLIIITLTCAFPSARIPCQLLRAYLPYLRPLPPRLKCSCPALLLLWSHSWIQLLSPSQPYPDVIHPQQRYVCFWRTLAYHYNINASIGKRREHTRCNTDRSNIPAPEILMSATFLIQLQLLQYLCSSSGLLTTSVPGLQGGKYSLRAQVSRAWSQAQLHADEALLRRNMIVPLPRYKILQYGLGFRNDIGISRHYPVHFFPEPYLIGFYRRSNYRCREIRTAATSVVMIPASFSAMKPHITGILSLRSGSILSFTRE